MKSKIGHITLSCCIGLLLCTVFAMNPYIEDGLLMGKFFWFHTTVFSLAIFNFISVVWIKWYKRPTFDWADGLVLLFALLTLLTYKWTLNPDPEKLLFIGQCVILWFLLKTISSQWENFARLSFTVIIVVGIAEALCMSRSKLYSKVKGMTGKSIVEFVLNYRIRKAARLIIEEDLTIREVMIEVGIESPSYFSKAFKKVLGETPTVFATKHKK